MKQLGIIDNGLELSNADGVDWDRLSPEKKMKWIIVWLCTQRKLTGWTRILVN
ncbi:hypothetical protein [Niabella hibiscisoli]|uniref:hypothetical protein n=1 Tax=Niabella hibiscisoli TaxID=1825928 RepID=UPI0021D448AC|nr:hypothetical protein [Niabella hibiscisoli]